MKYSYKNENQMQSASKSKDTTEQYIMIRGRDNEMISSTVQYLIESLHLGEEKKCGEIVLLH